MNTKNYASPQHPHEPQIAPQFDAEGRCLICCLLVKIESLESDNAALKLRVSELEERCEVDDVQWYNELGKVGSPQSEIAALRIRIGELESYVSLDPDLVKLLAGCPPADESLHKLKDARIASLEAQVATAKSAMEVAQLWLCNCIPTVELEGPAPLPLIRAAIERIEKGD